MLDHDLLPLEPSASDSIALLALWWRQQHINSVQLQRGLVEF